MPFESDLHRCLAYEGAQATSANGSPWPSERTRIADKTPGSRPKKRQGYRHLTSCFQQAPLRTAQAEDALIPGCYRPGGSAGDEAVIGAPRQLSPFPRLTEHTAL
jgi:hypothetical protein